MIFLADGIRMTFMDNLSNRFFRCWPILLLVFAAGSGRVLATGTWGATDSMEYDRYWFTATTLFSGQVLVTGGYSYETYDLATAELYDSTAGHWTETGRMRAARYNHTATLLPDGRVLVAAGYNGSEMSSAEIYNPATGLWSRAGSLNVARDEHAAALLHDGRVLVVGGYSPTVGSSPSTEIYDPATGRWTTQGNLRDGRWWPTATTL